MQRQRICLDGGPDGPWQFRTDPDADLAPGSFDGQNGAADLQGRGLTVPAPWQSQGPDLRDYAGTGWYVRDFELPAGWRGGDRCAWLHFGAVDYRAEVWVNDQRLGCHEGGYLPFEFDATHALRDGANRLLVRVEDAADIFNEIPHGKQSWYGMLSGIWQPVWLELRPQLHISWVRVTPDALRGRVSLDVGLSEPAAGATALLGEILGPSGAVVATFETSETRFDVDVPEPVLWDVARPNRYTARLTASASGASCEATFGFRTIETRDGKLLLNGQPVYLRSALDQDYYPELISTPPSYEYIEKEMRQALEIGFNCLRVHIKVADPRYYDAADRLGLVIWTELPNHASNPLAALMLNDMVKYLAVI
jgi:beta-galactosidase/beta-glucuronidase